MYDYDYSYYTSSSDAGIVAGIMGMLGVLWLIILAVCVIMLVCQWKIFGKAGQPGWKALIPFYNMWTLNQIVFGEQYGWLMFASFVAVIPVIGSILALAWYVYMTIQMCKAYGKSGGFAALIIFLPVIAYPMLAFGGAQYMGPQAPFFSKNGVAVPNGQWQNPQQNAWGQPQQAQWQQPQQNAWGQTPAQPQQDPWGQTPAQPTQPAQPPQWGQAPAQPQQDPWGTPNTGASVMNPGYQQQNPANGWGVAQNPATPPVPPQDPWGTTPSAPQTPPQVPNDNSNPFI